MVSYPQNPPALPFPIQNSTLLTNSSELIKNTNVLLFEYCCIIIYHRHIPSFGFTREIRKTNLLASHKLLLVNSGQRPLPPPPFLSLEKSLRWYIPFTSLTQCTKVRVPRRPINNKNIIKYLHDPKKEFFLSTHNWRCTTSESANNFRLTDSWSCNPLFTFCNAQII